MFALNIKDSANHLLQRLRTRAERHGRSMDDEAREILHNAVNGETPAQQLTCKDVYDACRAIAERHGGVDLELPPRNQSKPPVSGHG